MEEETGHEGCGCTEGSRLPELPALSSGSASQDYDDSRVPPPAPPLYMDMVGYCTYSYSEPATPSVSAAVRMLGFIERYLTLLILVGCIVGFAVGQIPGVGRWLDSTTIGTTNVMVGVGLFLMMLPELAKVRWNALPKVFTNLRLLFLTLLLNWVVGPCLMFLLAVAVYGHLDHSLMVGLALVGCAPCIALVLVWNQLGGGDGTFCAAMVALNSLLTICLYSPYTYLFVSALPLRLVGHEPTDLHVTIERVARSMAIYLGAPLVTSLILWFCLTKAKGSGWYYRSFTPHLSKLTLFSLLFNILVIFACQSHYLSEHYTHYLGSLVLAIAPFLVFFFAMFLLGFFLTYWLGGTYAQCVTVAFLSASNNVDLSLAVAVDSYGLDRDESMMSVLGALVEIPTMIALIGLAGVLKKRLQFPTEKLPAPRFTSKVFFPLTNPGLDTALRGAEEKVEEA